MERLGRGWGGGEGCVGLSQGKGDRERGEGFVVEGEEEGDRGWSNWRGGRGKGCVGLSQGKGDEERGKG